MDELFRVVFKNMEKCRKTVDRMHLGAVICTPTAENNARGLMSQGEGSCEVRKGFRGARFTRFSLIHYPYDLQYL